MLERNYFRWIKVDSSCHMTYHWLIQFFLSIWYIWELLCAYISFHVYTIWIFWLNTQIWNLSNCLKKQVNPYDQETKIDDLSWKNSTRLPVEGNIHKGQLIFLRSTYVLRLIFLDIHKFNPKIGIPLWTFPNENFDHVELFQPLTKK